MSNQPHAPIQGSADETETGVDKTPEYEPYPEHPSGTQDDGRDVKPDRPVVVKEDDDD